MEPKFRVGDRVTVVGHPSGRLPRHSYFVEDVGTNARYVRTMDGCIGREFTISECYERRGDFPHFRYYLEDNNFYWIEDWLDFAEPQINCSDLEIENLL